MHGVLNYLCLYLSQRVAITSKVLSWVVGSMFWMEKDTIRYIFYLTNILRILFHSYYNLAPHQRNSSTAWGWGGLRCSATRYRWRDREKGRSVRQGHVGVLFIFKDGRRAFAVTGRSSHHFSTSRPKWLSNEIIFFFCFRFFSILCRYDYALWSRGQRSDSNLTTCMSGMIFVWYMVKASCQIQMCWTCFSGCSWITDFFYMP